MADNRIIKTTIELSGEGSYKQKLKEIDSALKGVASEQRVIDAQYDKSDKSLAALTARQGVYQDRLNLQRQRLEAVRQEYERTVAAEGENSESAQRLAREYNNVSAQVAKTERQMAEVSKAMDASAESMKKAAEAAKAHQDALKKVAQTAEQTAAKLSKAMGATIAAVSATSVKAYMDFEAQMSMVDTLADHSALTLDQLSDQALETSRKTGIAAAEIASSAYGALSAGVDTGNVMSFMEASGKAAQAGKAGLDDAIDGATSAMNAWKISYDQAANVYSKFLTAQDKGKTTFGDMAKQMGQVTGLAPQLNISLDEVLASVAALTKNGVQTNSAFTGLKAIMSSVLKPTADAQKEAERLGLQFNAAALQAKGLTGFLADIQEKTQGDSESLAKLFGNVEGLSKVLLLGGAAANDYSDALGAISNSAGRLDEAFATVTDNRAARLNMALNSLKTNAIEFGRSLAPYVDIASDALGKLSVAIGEMSEQQMRGVLQTGLWITGALGMVGAISKIAAVSKTVIALMSGPAGWIALGVAGVAALGLGLSKLAQQAGSASDALKNSLKNMDPDKAARYAEAFGKINFSLDVDTSGAKSTIAQAWDDIHAALNESGLTEDQISQIEGMIGQDYQAIYDKLISFGLSPEEAAKLAKQVEASGQTILDGIKKLNLSVDDETAAKWITDANGSKLRLIDAAKSAGLTDEEVSQLTEFYDEMTGRVTRNLPNIVEEIYNALTDGKADDEIVVKSLKDRIEEGTTQLLADVDTWLKAAIEELDSDSDTYAKDVAALQAQAEAYRREIAVLDTEMRGLVDNLAGQPTEVVKARLAEFADIEERADALALKLEKINQQAAAQRDQNVKLVRAGAADDEETVSAAFETVGQGYLLDKKKIEDEAKQAVQEERDIWEKARDEAKLNGDDEAERVAQQALDEATKTIEAERQAKLEAAQNAYEAALQELFAGLAKRNPEIAARLQEEFAKSTIVEDIQKALDYAMQGGELKDYNFAEETLKALFDYTDMDASQLADMGVLGVRVKELAEQLEGEAAKSIAEMDPGIIGAAFAGILEKGMLEDLDISSLSDQYSLIFGGIGDNVTAGFTDSVAEGKDDAYDAASDMAQGAVDGSMDTLAESSPSRVFRTIGENAAAGLINGLLSQRGAVYAAARQLAQAAESGARVALEVHSPSRVFERIGGYTAEGLIRGVNNKVDEISAAMQRMIDPTRLRVASGAQVSEGRGAVQPVIQYNTQVRYSGAFTRNEARRFGRAMTDQMTADAAAKGAR